MAAPNPSYLALHATGELARRAEAAWELLRGCTVCPQNCPVDRLAGKTGACRAGADVIIRSWDPAWRGEPPITRTRGGRTNFFGRCQAPRTHRQKFLPRQLGNGNRRTPEVLAGPVQ